MDELNKKYQKLINYLADLKKAAVALSGGVDSSLLLAAAVEALGTGNVLAYTATGDNFPKRDYDDAIKYAKEWGAKHILINTSCLDIINKKGNDALRCYYCKKSIFSKLQLDAKKCGFYHILEASHADDVKDFRPGEKAIKELGILSPLKECCFTKDDIRAVLKKKDIEIHKKPSIACLVSRFPYNIRIEKKDVLKVQRSEAYLISLGFDNCRVRHFGELARLEVDKENIPRLESMFDEVLAKLKSFGYKKCEIDQAGYRCGSMNEGVI